MKEIETRIHTGIQAGDLRSMTTAEVKAQAYLVQGAYAYLHRLLDDDDYLLVINAATMAPNLVEIELFGIEEGALGNEGNRRIGVAVSDASGLVARDDSCVRRRGVDRRAADEGTGWR